MSNDASALFDSYEAQLQEHRRQLLRGAFGQFIMAGDPNPRAMLMFLAQFCSFGVAVTAPTQGWIRRAGEATASLGMTDLGETLKLHAERVATREQLMVADTRALCRRWREAFGTELDERALFNAPLPAGARSYIDLHERLIAGPAPYAQIAIEYEIERLSVELGPKMVQRLVQIFGVDVLDCISFITERATPDASRTEFSAKLIADFLGDYPEALPILIDTGARALRAFGAFMDDCTHLATERAARAA